MRRSVRCVVTILALILGSIAVPASAQDPLRVVVFTPATEGNTYWPQVYDILEATADDLGIELLIHGFDVGDRYAKADEGARILRSSGPVDGAIFSVAFGQTLPLLEVTEELGIPVMIQGPLFESELPAIGYGPRNAYASWIGLFAEDEFEKGRELGRVLLDEALAAGMAGSDGTVRVVGIGGDPSWFGSVRRADGLAAAVDEHPDARLLQVVPTLWTEDEGYAMAGRLMERYPRASVFWAASDQLAIGASRAVREAGRTVGEDAAVGGLDLSRRGLEYVEDGRLTATSASLLFGYARVLTYLFDYMNGIDFAEEEGTRVALPVRTATIRNAGEFLELYRTHERIDYTLLSRAHNPVLASYDFSPAALRAATVE